MRPLIGLIVPCLIAWIGIGWVRATPTLWRAGWPTRLAWSYLLGSVLGGAGLWAGSHWAGMPLDRFWIASLLGALVTASALLFVLVGESGRLPRDVELRRGPPRALLLLLLLPTLALLADAVATPVRDIDGRVTWTAHARYVRAAETVNAPIFLDEQAMVSHPRYPLLMPLNQVAVLELLDTDDDRVFRALYPTFWLAWLLIAFDLLELWVGRRAAVLGTLAAAAIPFAAFGSDGGAISAYNDLAIACMFGGGVALLLAPVRDRRLGLVAGVLLAGAVLVKNEGAMLSGVTLLISLAIGPRTTRRRLLAAAPLVALAFLLVASWASGIPNRLDEAYGERFGLASLSAGIAPFLESGMPELLRPSVDWRSWALFWPLLLPLVCLSLMRPCRRRLALLLIVGSAMAFYVAAYVISPWEVSLLVRVTWTRLLLQLSVPLILLAALDKERGVGPESVSSPRLRGARVAVGLLIAAHLGIGGLLMLPTTIRTAAQIRFVGDTPQTARQRALGESYALGLERAEEAIGPAGRYLLVKSPEDTFHGVVQGDLAPRWAFRPPHPRGARRRLRRGELPEWTVIYRGADQPVRVITTREWLQEQGSR